MLRLEELELTLWREASRHIEIGQASQPFAAALSRHLPLDQLLFFRLDSGSDRPTLAAVAPGHRSFHELQFEPISDRPLARIRDWIVSGEIIISRANHTLPPLLRHLQIQKVSTGDMLVIPLKGEHGSVGWAYLVAPKNKEFSNKHLDAAKVAQEPFAVALDNDRRVDEMKSLRAAAEADNISLLSRLGRRDLADTIIGSNSGLRIVMERVQMVQRSDVPALILGETGTGKELVARSIHQCSPRHAGPFIRVNCGAIPSELIDSQLFGHEKGSFTGATDSRAGWFERADHGTLFLDEIGELPLDAQVRLLRVLQDGVVERVGGSEQIHVDVRIVAATHRDLSQMVRDGRFREDLWYRLAVFPILLPPLRDRKEDIASLVIHLALKAAARFGLTPVQPTAEDIELLKRYDWPGNVRELGTVIDRAAILGEGKSLDFTKALGLTQDGLPISSRQIAPNFANSPQTLDQAMKLHIERTLRLSQGRIEGKGGAANRLDINPHTLRARMRKLGIQWQSFRADGT
jgi:transcriptional regulator with GAF, ATPase, and Fis domain